MAKAWMSFLNVGRSLSRPIVLPAASMIIEADRQDERAQNIRLFVEAASYVAQKGTVMHRPNHMDRFVRVIEAGATHRNSLGSMWGNRFKRVNVVLMTLDEKHWHLQALLRVRCFGMDNKRQHHFEAHITKSHLLIFGLDEMKAPQETPWGETIMNKARETGWQPPAPQEPKRGVFAAWQRRLGAIRPYITGMRGI